METVKELQVSESRINKKHLLVLSLGSFKVSLAPTNINYYKGTVWKQYRLTRLRITLQFSRKAEIKFETINLVCKVSKTVFAVLGIA